MTSRKPYSEKEIQRLRILFHQKKSDEQIADIMGRTPRSVADHRRKVGLTYPSAVDMAVKKSKHFTPAEVDFICNFWEEKTDRWMANKLRVTEAVYKNKRHELGFYKHWRQKKAYAAPGALMTSN